MLVGTAVLSRPTTRTRTSAADDAHGLKNWLFCTGTRKVRLLRHECRSPLMNLSGYGDAEPSVLRTAPINVLHRNTHVEREAYEPYLHPAHEEFDPSKSGHMQEAFHRSRQVHRQVWRASNNSLIRSDDAVGGRCSAGPQLTASRAESTCRPSFSLPTSATASVRADGTCPSTTAGWSRRSRCGALALRDRTQMLRLSVATGIGLLHVAWLQPSPVNSVADYSQSNVPCSWVQHNLRAGRAGHN